MRPVLAAAFVLASVTAQAQTAIRIVPVNGATIAAGAASTFASKPPASWEAKPRAG